MRSIRLALMLLLGLGLTSCAGMTSTEQSVGVGALGGAVIGGVAGSFSGNTGMGALLGAGVGGVGGYLYDQSYRSRRTYY